MATTRGSDRRTAHRRHEEAALHYAEQNLIAAALTLDSDLGSRGGPLHEAVEAYRYAEAQVAVARRARISEREGAPDLAQTADHDAEARWYEMHDGWVR